MYSIYQETKISKLTLRNMDEKPQKKQTNKTQCKFQKLNRKTSNLIIFIYTVFYYTTFVSTKTDKSHINKTSRHFKTQNKGTSICLWVKIY